MLLEKIIAPLRPEAARRMTTPRIKRTPGERLVAAITELAQGYGEVLSHQETAWASITFSGRRHSLRILYDGVIPAEAGEDMIAALPDHEFSIPGQLVADATISAVDHRLLPDERLEVVLEVLMLDEC